MAVAAAEFWKARARIDRLRASQATACALEYAAEARLAAAVGDEDAVWFWAVLTADRRASARYWRSAAREHERSARAYEQRAA